MIYEKNRTNEVGVWFIVIFAVLIGPALYLNEPSLIGKSVGVILSLGGVFLILPLLFNSIQKVTTYNEKIELNYILRKKVIPYSEIRDVQLREERHSMKGITRVIDVIDIYLYHNRKIQLGGAFGGFFKHGTKRLYDELSTRVQSNA